MSKVTIQKKPKQGRPEAKIDWKRVDRLLQSHCTGAGIASLLGIHPETFYRKCEEKFNVGFTEYSRLKKTEGKELLRAKQFDIALSGEKSLLIWLGKQYLEQADKLETVVANVEVPEDEVIEAAMRAAFEADRKTLEQK
jgi:transposase-like protein